MVSRSIPVRPATMSESCVASLDSACCSGSLKGSQYTCNFGGPSRNHQCSTVMGYLRCIYSLAFAFLCGFPFSLSSSGICGCSICGYFQLVMVGTWRRGAYLRWLDREQRHQRQLSFLCPSFQRQWNFRLRRSALHGTRVLETYLQ